MNHWLLKSEPETYSWADLAKEARTAWTGVRNFQARNNLRAMKRGDAVLFYHSGDGKEVLGLAKVLDAAYPDPTDKEGDWSAVDIAFVKSLAQPVTLAAIKADSQLRGMIFVKNSRLSVSPVTAAQFNRLLALAKTL
jgi:predicted RNA-binding protein with PUA-like domain